MKPRTDQIFLIAALFCLIASYSGHPGLRDVFWWCLLGYVLL